MTLPPMVRWLLWPVSVLYGGIARLRARFYALGIFKAKRLKTPVISVGNLTTGGTGKTPMVIWLAERFLAEGKRVGILSRGYKGDGGTSDEIKLMKQRLNARVLFGVGPNRYQQGLRLEKSVDLFLLDDGYQHLQLARDVNILLMDAVRPLGNESLLPSGILREPVSVMARADILVFTRTETSPGTGAAIEKLTGYPVFSAATRLLGFRRLGGGVQLLSAEEIGAGPFYAFCGIGNPRAFFLDLKNWGIAVSASCEFADHHLYDDRDVRELTAAAREAGARALLTTEKDAQNLEGVHLPEMQVYVAVIELAVSKEEAFLAAIRERLEARNAVT